VLQKNDGTQFDKNLVRRFVQLVGIYPAGNLVRLYSGEIAVVLEVHAPDPYRPRVRVVIDKDGRTLEHTRDVSLFDAVEGEPNAVKAPVDPADVGIDPLVYLQ
jgi:cyclic di-GMP phosphodiesterase